MEATAVVLGENTEVRVRELVPNVADSFESPDEAIACIEAYGANLYVCTTKGRILHYHHFDDAPDYILISQLQVSSGPIDKFLLLPQTETALILSQSIASFYTLPELSTFKIGKLKNTNDISIVSISSAASSQPKARSDIIIAFTPTKIRILQVTVDTIKLLKDVNYSNAIKGISTASKMSANYSNLVLVANDKNYDIIDLKHTRKIPLFEYNSVPSDRHIEPHIVPFSAKDKDEEEYLLVINSDETTSMSMFIDSLGDVTRGTITWIGPGFPSGGVVVEWPYVVGVFSNGTKDSLVFSSLETFEVVSTLDLKPIEEKKEDSQNDKVNEEDKKGNQEDKHDDEKDKDEEDDKQDDASENKKVKNEILEDNKEVESKMATEIKDNVDNGMVINGHLRITKVSEVSLANSDLNHKLSNTTFSSRVEQPCNSENDHGSILLYDHSRVWLTHQVSPFMSLLDKISTNEIPACIELLEPAIESYSGVEHEYLVNMLVVFCLIENQDLALKYLMRIKNGQLLINPLLVIHILSHDETKYDFPIFNGIEELLTSVNVPVSDSSKQFLQTYLDNIFPDLIKSDEVTFQAVRKVLYQQPFTDQQLFQFFKQKDSENWESLSETNKEIVGIIESKENRLVLLLIYQKFLDRKSDLVILEKYCALVITVLKSDKLSNLGFTSESLLNDVLDRLQRTEDEKVYSKFLLEVLKIDQDQAFRYLQRNRASKRFQNTHKRIMDEMSKSHSHELEFSLLRIEYLESSWLEDPSNPKLIEELLHDLINVLLSSNILTEENTINFDILVNTYKIENSLDDSKWPKISWIDYLHLNIKRSEAKQLLKLYVKVFELLQLEVLQGVSIDGYLKQLFEKEIFAYFKFFIHDDQNIHSLLDFHDYSSAEHYAIHGTLPFPKHSVYLNEASRNELLNSSSVDDSPNESRKSNLESVLSYYIEQSQYSGAGGIQHFAMSYGTTIFSAPEFLSMLPSSIPLVDIVQYLQTVMIDVRLSNRGATLKKALSKSDSVFTTKVYKNITNGL